MDNISVQYKNRFTCSFPNNPGCEIRIEAYIAGRDTLFKEHSYTMMPPLTPQEPLINRGGKWEEMKEGGECMILEWNIRVPEIVSGISSRDRFEMYPNFFSRDHASFISDRMEHQLKEIAEQKTIDLMSITAFCVIGFAALYFKMA